MGLSDLVTIKLIIKQKPGECRNVKITYNWSLIVFQKCKDKFFMRWEGGLVYLKKISAKPLVFLIKVKKIYVKCVFKYIFIERG